MNNIISIEKLSYRYNNDFIFHKLDMNIKQGEWITVVGPNASGKTTLIKILSGLIITDSNILIDNLFLTKENLFKVRKNIGVVFEKPDNGFISETVKEEISLVMKNLLYDDKHIEDRIKEIAKIFNIEKILNCSPNYLSAGEKQKIALACAIAHNPKIVLLDEALCMLDHYNKTEILEILNKLNKENGLTILNVTQDLEESFYSNRLIVINDGEILLDGPPKQVMLYDKVLNKIGIELPFIVDLSIKLKLYGLLDEIFFNMDEMVDIIWK